MLTSSHLIAHLAMLSGLSDGGEREAIVWKRVKEEVLSGLCDLIVELPSILLMLFILGSVVYFYSVYQHFESNPDAWDNIMEELKTSQGKEQSERIEDMLGPEKDEDAFNHPYFNSREEMVEESI